MGRALSTTAVYRSRSRRTSRRNSVSTLRVLRRRDSMRLITACRARWSSMRPSMRLSLNNRRAVFRASLSVFMPSPLDARRSWRRQLVGGFLEQPPLIVWSQHLARDGGAGLHDQAADLALELGLHAGAIASCFLLRVRQNLGFSGPGLPGPDGAPPRRRGAGPIDELRRLETRLRQHVV